MDGAISELREALRINPKNTEPHNSLGTSLWETDDLDGAI
jgi:Flp pilus assembly protein TadD